MVAESSEIVKVAVEEKSVDAVVMKQVKAEASGRGREHSCPVSARMDHRSNREVSIH